MVMRPSNEPPGRATPGKMLANFLLALSSSILALLLGEAILYFFHFQPFYPSRTASFVDRHPELRDFCRHSSAKEAREAGAFPRSQEASTDDQSLIDAFPELQKLAYSKEEVDRYQDYKRIVVLGDSFVRGSSADPQQGFVDLLNQHLEDRKIHFFNLGFYGSGQWQQLIALQKNFDTIRPDVVFLIPYSGNDFSDNMIAKLGKKAYTEFPYVKVNNYEMSWNRDSYELRYKSDEEIFEIYRDSLGCYDLNQWRIVFSRTVLRNHLVLGTRIGTLLYVNYHVLKHRFAPEETRTAPTKIGRGFDYEATKSYIDDIAQYLREKDVPLFVFPIPDYQESFFYLTKSANYRRLVQVLRELDLPVFEVFDHLKLSADYFPRYRSEIHWTNSGHRKMYEFMKSEVLGERS